MAESELKQAHTDLGNEFLKSQRQRKRNLTRAQKAEAVIKEIQESKELSDAQREQLQARLDEIKSIPTVEATAIVPYDPTKDPSLTGDPMEEVVGASPVQDPNVDQPPLDIEV